ncbi:hypothetical protein BN135_3823 [Cronobacter muytjensii 530]
MFAECAAIAALSGAIAPGETWLCCAAAGVIGAPDALSHAPAIAFLDDALCLRTPDGEARRIPLYNNK